MSRQSVTPPAPDAGPAADVTARAAVERARRAQAGWGELSPRARAQRMRALRATLLRRMDEVIDTVRAETGKPAVEALAHEVVLVAAVLRTYERRAPRLLRPRRVGVGLLQTKTARKYYEPLGVVGVVSPWNFPFSLPGIPLVSALFAGNAVVLKPSELTPQSGRLLGELVREAIPEHPDLVQVLEGGPEAGAALVRTGLDKLVFIGGSATGRKVLAAAAETLTPVVLELGASDVAIVCDDADLERAAAGVVWGALANAGQICISTERALVAAPVYERFADAVLAELRRLRVRGDGAGDVGRLIDARQMPRLEQAMARARERGARVVAGGALLHADPPVYAPTLVLDAERDEALAHGHAELFGPVLPLVRVRDDEEAVRVANASPYGLNASIWTASRARARRLARRLRTGSVIVNDVLTSFGVPELPYGGVGESGYGRLMGDEGLLEFVRTKGVTGSRITLRREPFWFPYTEAKYRLLRRAVRFFLAPGLRGRIR